MTNAPPNEARSSLRHWWGIRHFPSIISNIPPERPSPTRPPPMSRSAPALLLLVGLGTLTGAARHAAAQQPKGPPPAPPPQYPTLTTPANLGATPGAGPVELAFTGTNLADAVAVWTTAPGVTFNIPPG